MMNYSQDKLWNLLRRNLPRVLSQLNRDADSPLFGSFDRNFWHYKIRDFSSIILQQGMLVLDVLKSIDRPDNPYYNHPLMENWIQSYGAEIDAVFAQNDEMGMGALIALEQAKLKQDVVVASVDAIADALQAVKDGRLDATVFQDARGQGGTAIETAVRLARGEPCDAQVFIPFQLVTAKNVDDFLARP